MAKRPRKGLETQIYDMTPVTGRYVRDYFDKLLHRFSQHNIEAALADLCARNVIRKCGDNVRPFYVRIERQKVFYTNTRPLFDGGEQDLLIMQGNKTVTEVRDEHQDASTGR